MKGGDVKEARGHKGWRSRISKAEWQTAGVNKAGEMWKLGKIMGGVKSEQGVGKLVK